MPDPSTDGDEDALEELAVEGADEAAQSKKTEVIEIVFFELWPKGDERPKQPMIVDSTLIVRGISVRNCRHPNEKKRLSDKNPANFLKDLIRKKTCNQNWPRVLKERLITARQRYGEGQVFEFVDYFLGDTVPFPDRFEPQEGLPVIGFEALSIPIEARSLGRQDEPWLIQVMVSQKILYSHFALVARQSGLQVEALAHLQVSVKTQPEIDATFIATVVSPGDPTHLRVYVTAEAKQINERILEYQLREQVNVAFAFTSTLIGEEKIDAVMPVAFQVINYKGSRGIYVAQFEMITRVGYAAKYNAPERLHEMPLKLQSAAIFVPQPPIQGISYKTAPQNSRRRMRPRR